MYYLLLTDDDDEDESPNNRRSVWVRDWLEKRETDGAYAKLLIELRNGDSGEQKLFRDFMRMTHADFDYLLQLVKPLIEKSDTQMRNAISAGERLALTLHYLATGQSFRSLQFIFRIPQNTISEIIPPVLDAIWSVLKDEYVRTPSTVEEWLEVAEGFEQQWNFPHCLGAVDGKHVVMVAPPNSGSVYFNYKHTHSIVLMAICDANYKFLYVDSGCNGRISDGGVYRKCSFPTALESGTLHWPDPIALPGGDVDVPYVIVADDAFALSLNMMKPFPGNFLSPSKRIFNYRLSRARRVIENAFGIMSAKFRVLLSPILLDAAKTRKVTLACCALHNFLITRKSSAYVTAGTVDRFANDGAIIEGNWRREAPERTMYPLDHNPSLRFSSTEVKKVREEFEAYFMSTAGEVPWQFKYI